MMLKRFTDIILSLLALLFICPFGLIIALILKFSGEGHIFFIQQRIGYNGSPFGLIKFATMLRDSPKTGTITVKNDPRILPFGKYLRSTKINELPQILNIFKGDMSIIGPRPLSEAEFKMYPENVQEVIRKMKPGLSGMGSLFLRNEEDILYKSIKIKECCYVEDILPLKGALEHWYFSNKSFFLDMKIIAATIFAVIFPNFRFYLNWFDIKNVISQSTLSQYYFKNDKFETIRPAV